MAPTLDGVELAPPGDNDFMDPRGYFSPSVFDLEMSRIFPRCWIFVGDTSDLPEPGDYVTEMIGSEPIVVVRGDDGELRAFSNVCPHRAAVVAEGAGNCGKRFECPYHGWQFETDGRLVSVPYRSDFVEPFDTADFGLIELRLEVWERWMFVNVTGDAPPLLEYLEDIPAALANHDLGATTCVERLDDSVAANWKVMIDNAYCDYHLFLVHKTSLGEFVDMKTLRESIGQWTGLVYSPSPPPEEGGYPIRDGIVGEPAAGSMGFGVFPNFFISAYPNGGATVMWWSPTTIDTSRARVLSYTHSAAEDVRTDLDLLKSVQAQDYAICENVQRGLRSSLYHPGPQHGLELRIRGFQRRLVEMLVEEVAVGA